MLEKPRWYSSLKVEIAVVTTLLFLLGLGFLLTLFLNIERKMIADFEQKQVHFIESFVISTLKPIMLTGQATLMPTLLESYKKLASMKEIRILRKNGVEAFIDNATIKEVNKFIGEEIFVRAITGKPKRIISAKNLRLRQVVATVQKQVFREESENGKTLLRMMIPIKNNEECRACHGSDHQVRGVLLASFSVDEMELSATTDLYAAMKYSILALTLITLSMFYFFRARVLNPISEIVTQVNKIVITEKFDSRLSVTSGTEMGEIAVTFNSFIAAVEDFQRVQKNAKKELEVAVYKKTKELREKNQIIEEDMRLAQRVQQSLLPSQMPDAEDFKFYADYNPCLIIGGDFYDVFEIRKNLIGVFMADTTGHGSSAALLVSMIKTLLTAASKETTSPSTIINMINEYMVSMTPDDSNATIFYGIINKNSAEMTYTLAGHPSPVIIRKDGKIEKLQLSGGLVGAFNDMRFEDVKCKLNEGDRLFVYTDGLSEGLDENNKYFGEQRILSVLAEGKELGQQELVAKVTEELVKYTRGVPLKDDVAMLILDYKKGL